MLQRLGASLHNLSPPVARGMHRWPSLQAAAPPAQVPGVTAGGCGWPRVAGEGLMRSASPARTAQWAHVRSEFRAPTAAIRSTQGRRDQRFPSPIVPVASSGAVAVTSGVPSHTPRMAQGQSTSVSPRQGKHRAFSTTHHPQTSPTTRPDPTPESAAGVAQPASKGPFRAPSSWHQPPKRPAGEPASSLQGLRAMVIHGRVPRLSGGRAAGSRGAA